MGKLDNKNKNKKEREKITRLLARIYYTGGLVNYIIIHATSHGLTHVHTVELTSTNLSILLLLIQNFIHTDVLFIVPINTLQVASN